VTSRRGRLADAAAGTSTDANAGPVPNVPSAAPPRSHHTWAQARLAAYEVGRAAAVSIAERVRLGQAIGRTLATDLLAPCQLPRFASSAMDGWAVAQPASTGFAATTAEWQVGEPILAGDSPAAHPIRPGWARPIATGAPVPAGTIAVVRREHGDVVRTAPGSALLHLNALAPSPTPRVGDHIRPAGEEAAEGDTLLAASTFLTAPAIALAAVAGYDDLVVRTVPTVDLLLLGDELVHSGEPTGGSIRDAFGPSLPSICRALGLAATPAVSVADDRASTLAALEATTAPLVITTGGSSHGPADHLHPALTALGARFVIDGVLMRPGHPVIVAVLPDGRIVLGLPGNPLAALVCLASFGMPLADGLLERTHRRLGVAITTDGFENPANATRLVACRSTGDGIVAVPWQGSGMLRGLAQCELVAVIPPGGVAAGSVVETVPLPW